MRSSRFPFGRPCFKLRKIEDLVVWTSETARSAERKKVAAEPLETGRPPLIWCFSCFRTFGFYSFSSPQ